MAQIVIKHEGDTITLADLARKVEDDGRGYSDAVKHVKTGSWNNFESFMDYFNVHFRPLLQVIRDGGEIGKNERQLLNFLAAEMLEIFGEEED